MMFLHKSYSIVTIAPNKFSFINKPVVGSHNSQKIGSADTYVPDINIDNFFSKVDTI